MTGLTNIMQPLAECRLLTSTSHFLPSVFFISKKKRRLLARVNAQFDEISSDSYRDAAVRAAAIRFEETRRPDPLFFDPYAECLVSSEVGIHGMKKQERILLSSALHYRLATKFIDDKILDQTSSLRELRQIVLLTDGMDTRPYRLIWPRSTVIYDLSPETVFNDAFEKLQDSGIKISKTCMMIHVSVTPFDLDDLQTILLRKGFNGYKPSLWALQGLPLMALVEFERILSSISGLAMEGCLFIGELPGWLIDIDLDDKLATQRWMEKLFLNHGFRVSVINYEEVARNVHDVHQEKPSNVLFVARQLKLSNAQMETWRSHLVRIDEEGDEEGFEEL